jgi:hypothetical protein
MGDPYNSVIQIEKGNEARIERIAAGTPLPATFGNAFDLMPISRIFSLKMCQGAGVSRSLNFGERVGGSHHR